MKKSLYFHIKHFHNIKKRKRLSQVPKKLSSFIQKKRKNKQANGFPQKSWRSLFIKKIPFRGIFLLKSIRKEKNST